MIRKWASKYDPHKALPEFVLASHLKNYVIVLKDDR